MAGGSKLAARKCPPRKLQSETYTGPVTLSQYEMFGKQGISLPTPSGN